MDATIHKATVGISAPGWQLTLAERALIDAKSRAKRLGFAAMLLFFRDYGRFPRGPAEIDVEMVTDLARVLDVPTPTEGEVFPFGVAERTLERQRAELRTLFGFREPSVADAEDLVAWLQNHAVAQTRDLGQLTAMLEERCRTLAIEPPTLDRVERIVRAAVRAYEDQFAATIHARLSAEARARLDALLRPVGALDEGEDAEPTAGARAVLNFVRGDPGRASVNSVKRELERLAVIRAIALPAGLFDAALPHEIELCRRRVAVQPPSDLRRLPEPARLTWLAAFAHLRGRALTDNLVELLVETVHAIGARAERRVEMKVINELKKVAGKTNLLFEIANASLAKPDDTVRTVIFPIAGEETLRDLVKEGFF